MIINRLRTILFLVLTAAGVFLLLTACDKLITETTEITISGYPKANFVAPIDTCCRPCSIQFKDNSDGPRHEYLWDFGDGGSSTAKDPIHLYTAAGNFDVTLLIRDTINNNEDNDIKLNFIYIIDTLFDSANADFSVAPPSGDTAATFTFTELTQGEIRSSFWDFGDGRSSVAASPTHNYDTAGTYLVKMILSSPCDTVEKIKPLVVTN